MEPKDKMHSEPQQEVGNSEAKTESTETNEPMKTVEIESTVEDDAKEIEVVTNVTETVEKQKVAVEDEIEAVEISEKKVDVSDGVVEEQAVEVTETVETKDVLEDKTETEIVLDIDSSEALVEEVVEQKTDETAEVVVATDEISEDIVDGKTEDVDKVVEQQVAEGLGEKEVSELNAEMKSEAVEESDEVVKEIKTAKAELDYSKLSEIELINELRDLLDNRDFMEVYHKIDSIKFNFYKKLKVKVKEQKNKFIEDGGFEEDFKAESDPYEKDLKSLLTQYRHKKTIYNKQLDAERDENLKIKYEIIEEIKNLVNRKEAINKTFQDFKVLQIKWREIGLVPQANMKDLWENYHHHVENFYDYIKINQELRDLDLKKNLEEKTNLCEKAEELLIEPSVIKSFKQLQKLHESWREIGPVPRENREELWDRFKDTTTKINKKHQDYFDNRKKSQKKNYDAKAELCDKVEEIIALEVSSYKEWEDKSKDIIELQKYWRTIGFAPKKENNEIYERFRTICDKFFDKKREFYNQQKEIQSNNLQLKIDLCVQAEALQDSEDWKKTTDEFISIQKKWKEIGAVPRKHSDTIWKRFRSACDHFFEQKSKFFSTIDEKQDENLKLKNELIETVKNYVHTGNDSADFDKVREFQHQWAEIGHVPIAAKNDVQKRFRDAVNLHFDKLHVDDHDRNLLKFRNKVSDLRSSSRGQNKVYAERDKFAIKLKHIESDLIILKNNIGFFANSKNAEALIKDVENKIINNEEQIAYLKEKIRIIDEADNFDE